LKTLNFIARFSLALVCLVSYAHAQNLRTVAISETPAPGVNSSENFTGFSLPPALNNAGQTTFRGFIDGVFSEQIGIWSEGGGAGLALVARSGSPAPPDTVGDVVFTRGFFFDPVINSAGQTAFGGRLSGVGVTGINDTGLWSEGGGTGLGLVVREGSALAGTTGNEAISSFGRPVLNGAGQTAFRGNLIGMGITNLNNTGIWLDEGGTGLSLVVRAGISAPEIAGVNFGTLGDPAMNSTGQTTFEAFLTGPGVGDNSVWSEGGGAGLALIARQGSPVPGATGGEKFSDFDKPVINNAGQTAFLATHDAAGSGIWSEGGGTGLAPVALSGNVAPDVIDAATFSDFNEPVLNGAGQTAFRGNLAGTGVGGSNDLGIWSEGDGTGLALVARTGIQAPDVTDGAVFSDFSNPTLNGAGQTAFRGTLTGTDVNNDNNRGIWAEDRSGVLTLIAREGQEIDVDDGPGADLRTISALSFVGGTGNEDGRRSEFNDLGQLAFMIQFTDSSKGIFVSDRVAGVPGDFNNDDEVNGNDIDLLAAAVQDGSANSRFDLNGDGTVDFVANGLGDASDSDYLVRTLLGTEYGDADLDGDVDIADLDLLGQGFSGQGSGWLFGNFDGTGETDILDLDLLGQTFGFPAPPTALGVPEPTTWAMAWLATVPIAARSLFMRRRCRKNQLEPRS